MDWKFANAADPVTLLSPVSRWQCAGDVLAAVAVTVQLCSRRVLVGDVLVIVLAAAAVTVLSPGVAMCW